VIGGNAAGVWIEQVDETAVRATQDVNLALRRDDLEKTKTVLERARFVYRHASGEALVRMKLTSYRDQDRTHLRDLIDVGLVDAAWRAKFQPEPAARLQYLLDTLDG
jgi:hypothetical protein